MKTTIRDNYIKDDKTRKNNDNSKSTSTLNVYIYGKSYGNYFRKQVKDFSCISLGYLIEAFFRLLLIK
jgi:hypothetical protein